ncbi:MAG TPA: flagellar export chaperone FlgN, partial [Pirellulales bacterium]|nr:flagellar export chaperone FlgN [Pirellulales bacterium]
MTNDYWEKEIAALLRELSATQTELLGLLDEKRRLLVSRDAAALTEMAPREAAIVTRLQAFQERRRELLERARSQAAEDVRSAAEAIVRPITEFAQRGWRERAYLQIG